MSYALLAAEIVVAPLTETETNGLDVVETESRAEMDKYAVVPVIALTESAVPSPVNVVTYVPEVVVPEVDDIAPTSVVQTHAAPL
jgi:hypothetical protein